MEKNEPFSAFRVWAHYPDGVKMTDEIYGLSQDREARKAASKICQEQGIVTEVRLHSSLLPIDHDEQWRSLYKGRPLNDPAVAQELDAAIREDTRGEYVCVYWPKGRQFNGETGKTVRQFLAEDDDIVINTDGDAFNYHDLISGPCYWHKSKEQAVNSYWGEHLDCPVTEVEPYTADFETVANYLDCDRDKVAHIYQVDDIVFARLKDITD